MGNDIIQIANRMSIYLKIALVFIIISIAIMAVARNNYPSGYATPYDACRDVAMHTRGWDVWAYKGEAQDGSLLTIFFTDGINTLSCPAKQIESLWYADAENSFQTMLGPVCPDPDNRYPCPKWDYHGARP